MIMLKTLTRTVSTLSKSKCADCLDKIKVIGAVILENIGNYIDIVYLSSLLSHSCLFVKQTASAKYLYYLSGISNSESFPGQCEVKMTIAIEGTTKIVQRRLKHLGKPYFNNWTKATYQTIYLHVIQVN